MGLNCLASAAYVGFRSRSPMVPEIPSGALMTCQVLFMRKRIKVIGFKDWDTMFYNNLLSIPTLVIFSVLVEDWGTESLSLNLSVLDRITSLQLIKE